MKTKVDLEKENTKLESTLEDKIKKDKDLRTVFADLLNAVEYERDRFSGSYDSKTRKIRDITWYEIAFLIGELKADANYAMVIESRDMFRNNLDEAEKEIFNLKNPNKEKI